MRNFNKNFRKLKTIKSEEETFDINIKVSFVDYHKLISDDNYEYPIHQHLNYELIITDKTSYLCELNNIELEIESGKFLLIKPGDWHSDHLKKGQKHFVLHFNILSLLTKQKIMLFDNSIKVSDQISENPENILKYFKEFDKEANNNDRFSAKIQDSIMETMFWNILRKFPDKNFSNNFKLISKQLHFKNKLYSFLEKNYKKNIDVSYIAKQMGMSKRSLEYQCKSLLGSSPAKTFTAFRMQKAEELITNTDKTIQEICYELGFNNPFNFSRLFKNFYGKSPKYFKILKN